MIRIATKKDIFRLASFLRICNVDLTVRQAAQALADGEIMVCDDSNTSNAVSDFCCPFTSIIWAYKSETDLQLFLFISSKAYTKDSGAYQKLFTQYSNRQLLRMAHSLYIFGKVTKDATCFFREQGYIFSEGLIPLRSLVRHPIAATSLADEKDRPAINVLVSKVAQEIESQLPVNLHLSLSKNDYVHMLLDSSNISVVTYKKDILVGFATGRIIHTGNKTVGQVLCVYIMPNYRSSNLEESLLTSLLAELNKRSVNSMEIYWQSLGTAADDIFSNVLKRISPNYQYRGIHLFKSSLAVGKISTTSLFG